MTLEVVATLIAFAFVGQATPGPNTLMLLASGVNFGLLRTLPHIFGIALGFGTLLLAVGLGLGEVLKASPKLHIALKIAAGAYLLYLAWKIGTATSIRSGDSAGEPLTVLQAAGFQWVNPKAWFVAIGAMATYTNPENYTATMLMVAACFMIVLWPCALLWAGVGTALRTALDEPKRLRIFNITMGVVLALSLWPLLR